MYKSYPNCGIKFNFKTRSKLDEDSFYVVANKAGVKYLDTYSTCYPVDPKKAVAKYSNGVLKVTVPYQNPLDNLGMIKK